MKTYRYLYYKLYCIWLKKKDEVENARINAVMTLTFLFYINLISLAFFQKDLIGIYEIKANMRIVIPAIMITGGIINFLLLARKKPHEKIIEEFKSESEAKRKKGVGLTVLYIIVSIGIPLYTLLSA